ncbi:MAG: hypothetical protein AAGC81_02325 [Pseudomonadota bacterium]
MSEKMTGATFKAPELLELSIEWARTTFPDSVIVPEMSVADWGGASLDLGIITDSEVIGIEIKGEGDSPARLPLQGVAYPLVCRFMYLLCCPSIEVRCHKKRPTGWGRLSIEEGQIVEARPGARELRTQSPDRLCGTLWREELYNIARLNDLKVRGRPTFEPLRRAICDQMTLPRIHDEMVRALRERKWNNGRPLHLHKRIIDTRSPDLKPSTQGALL